MTIFHPSFGEIADNRVLIFDTTLRDGEQAPGFSMTSDEKVRMAHSLAQLRIDVIEAGFPAASPNDFAGVRRIAEDVTGPVIAALSRAVPKDIEKAAEALKPAKRARIHTFIATSELHMAQKLRMTPDQVLIAIGKSVALAKSFVADVEWSAEDASRSDRDFLCKAVEIAIAAGATTINLPDTVGYALPKDYGQMFAEVRKRAAGAETVIFSTHCHNDLGLAVANGLSALASGARQVESAINGIGERAGNTATEELIMAIRTRSDSLAYEVGIDTTQILKTSKLLSAITGFEVQPNKAIVGRNAFAHESGIHQDGVLKNALTYEIMTPESVGWSRSNLVLGKHSGRAAFRDKLLSLGYEGLSVPDIDEAFTRFKDLADRKKAIYDEDIIALVDEAAAESAGHIHLVHLVAEARSDGKAKADLIFLIDGKKITATGYGDGAVDASFSAVRSAFPHEARLNLFSINAITEGSDAQARTTVRLEDDGVIVDGQGADTDTIVSAARAYIHALNKLIAKQARDIRHTPDFAQMS